MLSRMQLLMILLIYFVIVGTIFQAVGATYNNEIKYTTSQKEVVTGQGFFYNFVTSYELFPSWLNTIFFGIPILIIILIGIAGFIPTVNIGG